MNINIKNAEIIHSHSNAIIIPVFEEESALHGSVSIVDQALDGIISHLLSNREIKGKYKEITQIYSYGKIPSNKVIVLGIGKEKDITADRLRVSTAEACKILQKLNPAIIDFSINDLVHLYTRGIDVVQSIVEGALLGSYKFNRYKNEPSNNNGIETLNIVVSQNNMVGSYNESYRRGSIIANAVIMARDMINEPANYMTPTIMSNLATDIAKENNLKIDVLDTIVMRKLGMGGILGVSQGSNEPPKLIILEYNGNKSSEIDLALVGKGITFDSGGISLKPSDNMGEMKGDMAGGAAVISTMKAIAQLQPSVHVVGIVPATENMPSGKAMHPGDIIKIMNGKTVEIISTDAEGRLILADSICYAVKINAKRIVDIATLTGGCRIALGDICTGSFSNNQELADKVIAASILSGEYMWQMPMYEEYKDLYKSDVADLKNSGGRNASAISAALFLGEFTNNCPWVHLDIAGTSISEKERGYTLKGATGVPVRTLINLVLSMENR
jgi:leucyl aminopeptidase